MPKHIHIVTRENSDAGITRSVIGNAVKILGCAGYSDPRSFVHEHYISREQDNAIDDFCYDRKAKKLSKKNGYEKLSPKPSIISIEPFLNEYKFRLACELGIINFPGSLDEATGEYDNALLYLSYTMITANTNTLTFGRASETGGIIAVANICMTHDDASPEEAARYVGLIALHELGHVFGLVKLGAPNHAKKSLPRHCISRDCIMNTNPENYLSIDGFCHDCLSALRANAQAR